MRKRSTLFCTLFMLFSIDHLFSLEIQVSPLNVSGFKGDFVDVPVEEALISSIEDYDIINCLDMRIADRVDPVASLIQAGSFTVRNSISYMIYGSVYHRSDWVEMKLSLYEAETDTVLTVFYGKVNETRIDSLIDELGERICIFLYEEKGIEERLIAKEAAGYIDLGFSPGYWALFSGEWSDLIIPYVHGAFTLGVALPYPRYMGENFEIFPKFGLLVDYGLGVNRSDYESFSFHSLQMALTLELSFQVDEKHIFSLIAAPGYQIDIMVQSRKYDDSYTGVSNTFLVKAGLDYMYQPAGKNISFGLSNMIDFAFYDDLMVSYKPSFRISYKALTLGGKLENE